MSSLYLGPFTITLFIVMLIGSFILYLILGDDETTRDITLHRSIVNSLFVGWFVVGLLIGSQTFTWDTIVSCDPHWLFPKFCSND